MDNTDVLTTDSSTDSDDSSQDISMGPTVYCCKSKCLKAPDEWEETDVPCTTCNANGFCHCGCINYPGEKYPICMGRKNYVYHVYFCCPLECFTNSLFCDEVDGIACKKCKAYGSCKCKCKTYMKRLLDNHCCPNLCINLNQYKDCLLCEGYCRCLCVTYQKELLTNLSAVRINKKEMACVTDSKRNLYCCSRECFKIPQTLLYGIACTSCKHINYCQCQCLTFETNKKY